MLNDTFSSYPKFSLNDPLKFNMLISMDLKPIYSNFVSDSMLSIICSILPEALNCNAPSTLIPAVTLPAPKILSNWL